MRVFPAFTDLTSRQIWRHWWRSGQLSQALLLLACLAGVAGLLASRALIALSPVAGVVAALANPELRRQVPKWLRLRTVWAPAALYALLLLSGLYTENWPKWQHELFRLLPWLGVPLVFGLAVPLSGRQRFGVGCAYVGGTALVGLATMTRYLTHAATANEAFSIGQNLPSVTKIFHIHFGVMLALAAFFGVLLRQERWATRGVRLLLLLAAAVCALTLHVLAYRTGLLLFYGMLLIDTLLAVLVKRRLWLGLALLTCLTLVPWGTFQYLDSVQRRYYQSRHDLEQFEQKKDINLYSLSRRLAAWETALAVVRQQPWLGVGPADAYGAMMRQYQQRDYGLRPENRVMIHNQYLHQLVGGGIMGLALWGLVLFGPLAQPGVRRNPYVYRFLLIQALAMLVDSLLELQTSYNLFVFLYGFLVVATERRAAAGKTFPSGDGITHTFV